MRNPVCEIPFKIQLLQANEHTGIAPSPGEKAGSLFYLSFPGSLRSLSGPGVRHSATSGVWGLPCSVSVPTAAWHGPSRSEASSQRGLETPVPAVGRGPPPILSHFQASGGPALLCV